MTRILFDGFDSLVTTNVDNSRVSPRWDSLVHVSGNSGWGAPSGAVPTTRFGTGHIWQPGNGDYLLKTLAAPTGHIVFGFALSHTNVAGGRSCLIALYDGATKQGVIHTDTDGSINYRRGTTAAGTLVGKYTFGTAAVTSAWIWVEVDITIDPAAGVLDIWIEGVRKVHLTGQNTANAGTSQITRFMLGQEDTSINFPRFDDFYALDAAAGSAPWNARLGDCRAYLLTPSAAGDLTQLTPDAGSNYQRVASDDDDTSYVATATVGNADLYQASDLSGTFGQIFSLAHHTRWRKDDAGSHTAAQLLKSNGVTNQGSDLSLTSSYQTETEFFDTDFGNGGAAWAAASVNALQHGSKMTA